MNSSETNGYALPQCYKSFSVDASMREKLLSYILTHLVGNLTLRAFRFLNFIVLIVLLAPSHKGLLEGSFHTKMTEACIEPNTPGHKAPVAFLLPN